MTLHQIKVKINGPEYDFLRENEYLGKNMILITLGGSHAYGTNVESSDLDIRGCALNTKEDILLGKDFEQIVNYDTDTTVYSFTKLVRLLANNNPNTIEILGCKPEHYLYLSPIGEELFNNKDMFLSKRCIKSFGGYASDQIRRLDSRELLKKKPDKMAKHMMHLIRLYYMCFDILEKGEINTYREKEHHFLMAIRSGFYLNENHQPTREFLEIVDELEAKFERLKNTTELPDEPDINRIKKFVMDVNERVVLGKA